MLFRYRAIDTDGHKKQGDIEAPDRNAAINALQRRELVITSLEELDSSGEGKGGSGLGQELTFLERITNKDIVILSRQMATMFTAQVSALQVFKLLSQEMEKAKLRRILVQVADDLEAGSTISDALAKHPEAFSSFYVNMVKAGEESGLLDETFEYMADHLDRMYELNSKARNALIYPAFVLVVFAGVMALMFTMVLPQIGTVLTDTGQELPIYTKLILGVSEFFRDYWVFIVTALVIGGVAAWKYVQTPEGRRRFDRLKIEVPYLGSLYRNLTLARIAGNMNTMLASGIPMVRGLEITRDIINNTIYKEILDDAAEDVKAGSSLSATFAQYPEMPGVLVQMIKVGEETGELGRLLSMLSDFYKREVETAVDTLVSMIEPIMIVILGIGVFILLAAVLMPIYNLASGF